MDDMRLDPTSNKPARQPEAVAASLIGQRDPADRPASTHRLDEIFREVDLDSKARIARHAAEEHTPQGIARKAAERERSRLARTTHNSKAPVHSDPNAKRKPRLLDEDSIEALREFADDEPRLGGYFPDSKVFGLSIFLGAKSTVWRFRQQGRNKGKRSSVFKTLGNWPAVTTDEARKQALRSEERRVGKECRS